MSLKSHIDSIEWRCKKLDNQIHKEESRPSPSDTLLHELKLKRLKLRDELLKVRDKV